MPRKAADEWGSAPETLQILSEVNGREINRKYLHQLWHQGKLERKPVDGRTFLYNLSQARIIKIIEKRGSGRRAAKEKEVVNG